MQPNKIESVHGYLAPKRILSSLMTPSKKDKINRSMTYEQINNAPPADPNASYQEHPHTPNKSTIEYLGAKRSGVKASSNARPDSEDNFILDRQQTNLSKPENSSVDFIKVYNEQNGTSSRVSRASKDSGNMGKKPQINLSNSRVENMKEPDEPGNAMNVQPAQARKFVVPNKPNPQIFKLSVQDTITKLGKVKASLEQEIASLKRLLDETSLSLETLDSEFEQMKERILFYTSKTLDAAFREYKKNLPNWSIYQGVEEKGLNKIAELNQTLEVCSNEEKFRAAGGKEVMEKKLDQFKMVVQEVRDAKAQCFSHRPIIQQQKIRKLEQALQEISQF